MRMADVILTGISRPVSLSSGAQTFPVQRLTDLMLYLISQITPEKGILCGGGIRSTG